jgi:OFA family oxalate/formate antiporter-like MFS transporter
MNPESMNPGKSRVFYGWFALAGVMLVIFVVGGAFVNSFSVLLPVITSEFEWSRGAVALALSLGILAFGLPSPFYGVLVDRLGPRFTIIAGNALAALGMAGVYFIQGIWHIYLLYILIGLGGGFGGYIACTTVANNWFIRKRSLAMGIFTACSGLGGFVFPPLTTALIDSIGWREAWLVLAGLIFILATVIGGVFLTRNRPEDMGLLPDGMPADPFMEAAKMEPMPQAEERHVAWHIKDVFKQPSIWFIGAFSAANSYATGTMVTHQIAYLEDIGFPPMTAATTLSFLSVASIIGSLGFGALAMKYKVRYLASIAFGIQLAGLVILLNTRELALIYVYAAFQGMSNGALITALPTFVGGYYPRDRYAQVLGVVFPFQITTNAFSTTIAGVIYDTTNSYTPAFITAACFSMAGIIFSFIARRPKASP